MTRKAIIAVLVALVVSIVGLSISRSREFSKRLACAMRMKQIGASAKLYASHATGETVVGQLVQLRASPMDRLICPSSGLQHSNYMIVRPTPPIDDRTVVVYEPKSNHGDGGNFLFADGHASFISGEQYDLMASNPTTWWNQRHEEE